MSTKRKQCIHNKLLKSNLKLKTINTMKKIKFLLSAGLMLATVQITYGQHINMNSTPAPGVHEASGSITLQPGFSFTASPGSSLTLRINPNPCISGNPVEDFSCRMNHIFRLVDKSRIATGLLSDYGLQIPHTSCRRMPASPAFSMGLRVKPAMT